MVEMLGGDGILVELMTQFVVCWLREVSPESLNRVSSPSSAPDSDNSMGGVIDEVRIWTLALSGAQILTLAN